MKGHILWFGWIGLLVVFFVAVGLLLRHQGIESQVTALENQRRALEADHQRVEAKLKKDLQRYIKVLRRFPWVLKGGSGTAFLSRLSDVAADHLLKILGVGPLERKKIGHVQRIGRRVKVTGSFFDILGVVQNVERNRGIMEGLKVEQLAHKEKDKGNEILEAEFSLVTVELSTAVRQRMRSVLAAALASKQAKDFAVAPAYQSDWNFEAAGLRDPFLSIRASKAKAAAKKVVHARFPEVKLSGVVNLLNKKMAIINNRMVGEGDRFDGVLVERVTDDEVVLKSEAGGKRIRLPASMSSIPGIQN
jgi:hypothetical protein